MSLTFSVSEPDLIVIGERNLEHLSSVYTFYFPFKDSIVEVLLVDRPSIQRLNLTHRKLDEPTDVLSFPLFKPEEIETANPIGAIFGSIVICPEKAEEYNESLVQLVHHGLLHIIGYDHETDFQKWTDKEKTILFQLNQRGLKIPAVTDLHV